MDKILEILKNNDWDNLKVVIDSASSTTNEDFKHEDDFVQFVNDNIEKYDAEFEGYESVFNNETNKTSLVFKFKFNNDAQLSNDFIKSLGEDIMIDLTPDEIADIKEAEGSIRQKFSKVTSIDTSDVEPMFYPFETAHTYLREDDDMHTADHEGVMENAPTKDDGYVTIVKVVK